MLDRLTNSLDFQAQALNLRAERQRLIASNIANADTPGYQARDFDVGNALRASGVAGGSSTVVTLSATAQGHLGMNGQPAGSAPDPQMLYASPSQTNLDSNSVDMDRERASFADNTVQYEASLRFINSQVRTLLTAITGQ
jgi:flagellar basal-body rod protein FlgB